MNKSLIFLILILTGVIINAQWTKQNTILQTNTLTRVKFISSNAGWAVGFAGTIIKTTDGGVSWQIKKSGVSRGLTDIVCVDNYVLYAGCEDGKIIKSTDSGENWQILTSYPETGVQRLCFINERKGWVLTSSSVYKTMDGGKSFTKQADLETNSSRYINIVFYDENNGMALCLDNTISRTTDGGATWQTTNTGFGGLLSVRYKNINSVTLYLKTGQTVKSSDGGATWQTPSGGAFGFNYVNDIAFADENNGIATGSDFLDSVGKVFKTTDGGASWTFTAVSSKPKSITSINASEAVIVGEKGQIIKSTNGGTSWFSLSKGVVNNLYGVFFTDKNTGIAVGAQGIILRTTNSGEEWKEQNSGVSLYLNSVFFADKNIGIAVGDKGTILKTTDGGITWISQTSGTDAVLYGIHFIDNKNGVVVGSKGTVLCTTDGGQNWISAKSGVEYRLNSIWFASNNICVAVGEYGLIIRSTDGGATWPQQKKWDYMELTGVRFIDGSIGIAVGVNNIFRTTNGGINWTAVAKTWGNGVLRGVHFSDSKFGTAVGDNGLILRTTDGGINWNAMESGCGNYLYSVAFTDLNTGTIVGGSGTILHTTNGGIVFVKENKDNIASEFKLSQNYPNPFNPTTEINYELKTSGIVSLKVFDMLGRETAVLVNGYQKQGTYSVNFNAARLSSGVYFYTLKCGDKQTITKKMILLR